MPVISLRAALLTTIVVAGAAPATGHAATVLVSQPCQVVSFGLSATLSGFPPNSPVSIRSDQIFASGTTDATGTATIPFNAPLLGSVDPGSKQFVLTAQDQSGSGATATTTFRSANFAFGTTGGRRSPRATRTWRFSGFTPGLPIYGHFRYNFRTRANRRFGLATSPCGELTVHAPGIPVKGRINTGRWSVQIDQKRTFSRATKPRLTGSTTVYTVYS